MAEEIKVVPQSEKESEVEIEMNDIKLEGNMDVPAVLQNTGMAAMKLSGSSAREWITKHRQTVQPWSTFVSTSRFTKPTSVAVAGTRVVKNIEHFQSNYLFVFIILAIYCIMTSPMLIIFLGALFGAFYWINVKNQSRKLKIGSYELTLIQQYGAVAMLSIPLFFLAGAGSAVFWVLGASFFFVMLHAVFYNPQDQLEELQMEEVSFGSA
ncbi:prenylated Rab acceptor protein 1 [Strongylocentrotus purpuratus]|uniref:PRA1 family protein n=1 Tax=Strongylocentrotus purpuratus TaxID=7668 RepID=A0A7M7RF39_STRPU|nr:prenylated Rab acceptor protein 1 [Strongylocentrotus purpuratus]|eukprot:XP_788641.3 PREDICTED: prenylated Rab acceptor protein 1 [Strongylocentrotus purpuratus]